MSNIKPSDHGIVVEHKVSGVRYASLDENYDPKTERKVRDLRTGETVHGYTPKPARASFKANEDPSEEDLDTEGTATESADSVDGQ